MWDWHPPIQAGEGESAVVVEIITGDWHDALTGDVPPLLAVGTWQCDCSSMYIHWDPEHGGDAECVDCEERAEDGRPMCSLYELVDSRLRADGFFSDAQSAAFCAEYERLGLGEMAAAYVNESERRRFAAREAMARSPAWWRERG